MTIQADNFIARTGGFGPLRTAAVRALIDGLVGNGVWAKLDALYLTASLDTSGTGGIANQKLNLVSSSYTLVTHGSPVFVTDQGYTGVDVSTTVYLDTGFVPSTAAGQYAFQSAHVSAWSRTNIQGVSGGSIMGIITLGGDLTRIIPWLSDGNYYTACVGNPSFSAASSGAVGYWVVSRTGATTTTTYKNGSVIGNDTASGPADLALESSSITILAEQNMASGTPSLGSANQISIASIGGGLTGTDVTNLYNAANTYMALLPFGPDLPAAGTTTYHWNLGVNV